jgi:hypothetical protein
MSQQEAENFEKSDSFELILRMRKWDEMAKDTGLKLAMQKDQLLTKYKNLLALSMKNNGDQ